MNYDIFFGALIGSIYTGAIVGAIPAICGAVKGKIGLAIGGFLACLVSAILLGLILAVPCCALFLFLIFKKKAVDNYNSVSASPLDTMRITFDSMNITQKRAYIEKLKVKAQSSNNSAYTKFFNECVQKYNAELYGDLPIPMLQETLEFKNKKKQS